jgi:hypothetical protein
MTILRILNVTNYAAKNIIQKDLQPYMLTQTTMLTWWSVLKSTAICAENITGHSGYQLALIKKLQTAFLENAYKTLYQFIIYY